MANAVRLRKGPGSTLRGGDNLRGGALTSLEVDPPLVGSPAFLFAPLIEQLDKVVTVGLVGSLAVLGAPSVNAGAPPPSVIVPTMTTRIDWENDGAFTGAFDSTAGRILEPDQSWQRGRSADF